MAKDIDMESLVAVVKEALRPELNSIHGRITEVAGSIETFKERGRHTPTKEGQASAIKEHKRHCEEGRRWSLGIIIPSVIGVTALVVSIFALKGCV